MPPPIPSAFMSCFVTRMVSLSLFPEAWSLWTLTLGFVLWLESLELRGCGFTADCQIKWILRHSPTLRSLKFDGCAIAHRLVLWPTRRGATHPHETSPIVHGGPKSKVRLCNTRWADYFDKIDATAHPIRIHVVFCDSNGQSLCVP